MAPQGPMIIVVIAAMALCGVMVLVFLAYGGLWIKALSSGVHIPIFSLLGMTLRGVRARVIVEGMIAAHTAGLRPSHIDLEAHCLAGGDVPALVRAMVTAHQGELQISDKALKAHQLAGGDIEKVVVALIGAKQVGLEATFEQVAAHDLLGNDVLEVVKRAVETGEIEKPGPNRP